MRNPERKPDSPIWHERDPVAAETHAKNSYLAGIGKKEIVSQTGITPERLEFLIYGSASREGWLHQRRRNEQRAANAALERKRQEIEVLLAKSTGIISNALVDMEQHVVMKIAENKVQRQAGLNPKPVMSVGDIHKLSQVTEVLFELSKTQLAPIKEEGQGGLNVHMTGAELISLLKQVDEFGFGEESNTIDVTPMKGSNAIESI